MIKMRSFLIKFILFFLFFSIHGFAQNSLKPDDALNYINGKFGSRCRLDLKNGVLKLDFFDDKNENYRKDVVTLENLVALRTKYEASEKMIYLFCSEKDCVERKLMGNTKVTRLYDRLPIVWNGDEKSGKGLEKAFTFLIQKIQDPSYKDNTPFE